MQQAPVAALDPVSTPTRTNVTLWFAGFLAAYLLLHIALRLSEAESLRWDECEQTLFSQRFALGYNDQPPVYTWLLRGMFRVTGVSVSGVYLLKMLILAAIYTGIFAVGRRLMPGRDAFVATLALLIAPYFAWSVLIDGAHTVYVAAFVPPLFLVVFRLLDRPTAVAFALLGLVVGLGILAKYSFALLAVAVPLALATIPAYRQRLKDPRLVISVLVALLIVLPHAMWMKEYWALVRERPMQRGGVGGSTPFVTRVVSGLGSLINTSLLAAGPLLAALVLCHPVASRRVLTQPARSDEIRLVGRWLAIVLVLLIVIIVLGVTHFRIHWLVPVLVLLPVYMCARFAELETAPLGRRVFVATIAVAILASFAFRVGSIAKDSGTNGKHWAQDRLMDAVVAHTNSTGAGQLVFVGEHPILCGNLRIRQPEARVVCTYYPAFVPDQLSATDTGFIVWDATLVPDMPTNLSAWLTERQMTDRYVPESILYVDMPGSVNTSVPKRVGLMRFGPARKPAP